MTDVRRGIEQGRTLRLAIAVCALVALSCESREEVSALDGVAGALGEAGAAGAGAAGTGGAPEEPWTFEPLISEQGEFMIAHHDHRLILGTWEALRIERGNTPFTFEFVDTAEVSVEAVEGEP